MLNGTVSQPEATMITVGADLEEHVAGRAVSKRIPTMQMHEMQEEGMRCRKEGATLRPCCLCWPLSWNCPDVGSFTSLFRLFAAGGFHPVPREYGHHGDGKSNEP